jgi:hypothetical protein
MAPIADLLSPVSACMSPDFGICRISGFTQGASDPADAARIRREPCIASGLAIFARHSQEGMIEKVSCLYV